MLFIFKIYFLLLPFLVKPATPELAMHPFYVSVTQIDHNAADKTLEISMKFFLDDFEHTLEKAYKARLDINSEKEKAAFDKLIPDYVAKHFSVQTDGRAAKLNYMGYELDKESVYCYFEIQNIPAVKKLDISNNLLHDFSNEQINILHVSVNGKRQSDKLSFPDARVSMTF